MSVFPPLFYFLSLCYNVRGFTFHVLFWPCWWSWEWELTLFILSFASLLILARTIAVSLYYSLTQYGLMLAFFLEHWSEVETFWRFWVWKEAKKKKGKKKLHKFILFWWCEFRKNSRELHQKRWKWNKHEMWKSRKRKRKTQRKKWTETRKNKKKK